MEGPFYRKQRQGFDLSRLLRNRRLLISLLVGLPILSYVVFGSHGIIQRVRLEAKREELEATIKAAEEETLRLEAESKALDTDKKAIEKVAREKYGMAREGETVYRVKKGQE
jgi:cell division protein FtsB